jgi:hypothetical protein
MTSNQKRRLLISLIICTICIVLFSGALSRMELKPGIPLPPIEGGPGGLKTEESNPFPLIIISPFLKALGAIILITFIIYSCYGLFKGLPWRSVLKAFLPIFLVIIIVMFILFALTNFRSSPTIAPVETPIPIQITKGPPLGSLPPFLLWLVTISLAAIVILLVVWFIRERNRLKNDQDALALQAEWAMQAITAGADLKNVILQCYRQMSLALQKEQGLVLEETMTAREFESLVEAKGFPHGPVEQLTRLFETARYSLDETGPNEEQAALQCLNSIVQYSREIKMQGKTK